ncbi:MAG: transporter substrate-binding domain-containing protein, partial [Betaproteobacteria bacterium]
MKRMTLNTLFAVALVAASGTMAQDKPMLAGVDGTFAPHAMPKVGGGVEGFNIDLIMEIGKQLGRKIDIQAAEFSGL